MSTAFPPAPLIDPAAAENVPVPLLSRLMPAPRLFVEDALSRTTEPPVDWMSTAGPLVLLTVVVGGEGTVRVPALLARRPVPPVVVTEKLDRVKVPVPPTRLKPPALPLRLTLVTVDPFAKAAAVHGAAVPAQIAGPPEPATSRPSTRELVASLTPGLPETAGRFDAFPANSVSPLTTRSTASPSSRWSDFSAIPAF